MASQKIIYSRGFPYGAPLVMIRGGGTKRDDVKKYIKDRGWRWNSASHAWETYLHHDQLLVYLETLRDRFGCEVVPKTDLDPNYILKGFGK